jgi:transcriptional regulator with XRE-family HTH domain
VGCPSVPRRRPQDDAIALAFGRQLRALRKERKLTQERLAEMAGVHSTFVSNLECGRKIPTLVTIIRMADALEVRLAELVDTMEDERSAWAEQRSPSSRPTD